MTNPTPTPLASTAMEAAREFATTIVGLSAHSMDRLAATIQRHFQPLLAKVEGERDEWKGEAFDTLEKAKTELTALRADFAAAKEAGDARLETLRSISNSREDALERVSQLTREVVQLKADLAAKEADTRRIDLLQKMRDIEMANAAKRRDMSLQIFIGELSVRKAIDDATPALASRADKGGAIHHDLFAN